MPFYRKNAIKLKRLQKRLTGMLLDLARLCYERRLDRLCLSLEHGRLTSDLIKVYKAKRGIDKVNSNCFLPRVRESKT